MIFQIPNQRVVVGLVILSLFGFDHGSSRVRGDCKLNHCYIVLRYTMARSGLAVEFDKLVGRVGIYYILCYLWYSQPLTSAILRYVVLLPWFSEPESNCGLSRNLGPGHSLEWFTCSW